ncbi:MAG: hypothetical protein KA247_09240 [Bacteroidetes bacterium]|nr:hypothetical protein [Bacteroidota bacterium]
MRSLVISVLFVCVLTAQNATERILLLNNGDKIAGSVVSENDSVIVLKTSFGELSIRRSDIKYPTVTLYLKDGSIVSGDVLSHNDQHFLLRTSFGIVTIEKEKIERTSEAGAMIPGSAQQNEFLYSRERLTDIFFDPTGFTLEKGSIYFSGLSWGVALSEDIDISSSYWRYFFTDMNIRPKFRIFKRGNITSEDALSVGFHFHSAGPTGKMRFVTESGTEYDPVLAVHRSVNRSSWRDVGTVNDYFIWTELFAAYTHSVVKPNGQGRLSFHTGASLILHRTETMPRFWAGVESDITDRFKIIGQVYYDRFQPSYREAVQEMEAKNPLNLDFGFVYAVSESFRLGIHYQPYILLFYFKF